MPTNVSPPKKSVSIASLPVAMEVTDLPCGRCLIIGAHAVSEHAMLRLDRETKGCSCHMLVRHQVPMSNQDIRHAAYLNFLVSDSPTVRSRSKRHGP